MMCASYRDRSWEEEGPEGFATTHWSRVLAAGKDSSFQATHALNDLCRDYWYPLYVYVRRRGYSPHDAQDLTQSFFARLLERRDLRNVDRAKGKFRSYLLAAMNNFLANEWDRLKAAKRGGGQTPVSLETEAAEGRYIREPAVEASPDEAFEMRWAVAVMERALAALREDFERAGRGDIYGHLRPYLVREAVNGDYEKLAPLLSITGNAVAQAVRRLRQQYRQCVRTEIGRTVSSPFDIDEEMRHLFGILSR